MPLVEFKWQPDGAGFAAEMPDQITLVITPDRTKNFGTQPARGTTWRAQASQWDAQTRTISRFGRDEYRVQHKSRKEARSAAEQIYLDAINAEESP